MTTCALGTGTPENMPAVEMVNETVAEDRVPLVRVTKNTACVPPAGMMTEDDDCNRN